MVFDRLFEPLVTPKITLKNRLVVPAMETTLGGLHGEMTPELLAYWEARAKGGFGTLILENSSVDPGGNVCLRTPGFYDDSCAENLRLLPETVHKYGAKMVAQLCHVGRQTLPGVIGQQPVSASPIPCPFDRVIPRELTTEEIYEIIERFATAARVAKLAGFDAVEIHGAHGYLIAQFMSGYVNKRTDEFGGDLLQRMRFPLEILRRVRQEVGPEYPIFFRISGDERIPGGRTLQETAVIAPLLEAAGVDVLDISAAVSGSQHYISAPGAIPPGYLLDDAAAIRKAVNIPVIAAGRLSEPIIALHALTAGKADLVAIGRGSLADPELPNKIAAGDFDDIAPCISCNQGCYKAFPKPGEDGFAKYHTTCLVNPFCCEETNMVLSPAEVPKRVVVVGGGPAGLIAAWTAAARGHRVTLLEKEARLGGQLYAAAIPPFKQDFSRVTRYYTHCCEKYGVEIRKGVDATAETVLAESPDAVILATGAVPLRPDMPGVDKPNVCTALDVLEGRVLPGHRVLIVGGNMVGCETADYLGEHLHDVTVVKRKPLFAADVAMQTRPLLMERLARYGVCMRSGVAVKAFTDSGILADIDGQETALEGFDTVIIAMGAQACNPLQAELEGKVDTLIVVGDAKAPRQALDATEEGAKAGLAV